jgi:hypothetical protein
MPHNNLLTLQICEQISYKKNTLGIEYVVFFSHIKSRINLQQNFLIIQDYFEKNIY